MRVGELQEFINRSVEQGDISLTDEVIVVGEYNYGKSLDSPYITRMSNIDEDIKVEDVPVLAIGIESYIYEHEDVGNCDMWVDEESLQWFKELMEEEE